MMARFGKQPDIASEELPDRIDKRVHCHLWIDKRDPSPKTKRLLSQPHHLLKELPKFVWRT